MCLFSFARINNCSSLTSAYTAAVQPPTHVPVLLSTVLDVLMPTKGESVLDVTLGLGGHSEAFLNATSPDGQLIALDADLENLSYAQETFTSF